MSTVSSPAASGPTDVVTPVDLEQIRKAKARAAEIDLGGRIREVRGGDATPRDLNSTDQLVQRQNFLSRSLGDPYKAARFLERVLEGNELQPVNYLARGAIAARAIARIEVNSPSGARYAWGSGFLVAPRVLLTNHHVLPSAAWADHSCSHFLYEADFDDNVADWVEFGLDPDALFYTSEELDFTVVALRPTPARGTRPLEEFGHLPLLDTPGKASEGEWLTIVQHPNGEPKQVCVRENRLLKRADDVLWYSTDTLGGSSGSPVFNNDWYVVALHHSGIPEEKDGKYLAVDGNYYDPAVLREDRVKWKANEGIRASRIAKALKGALPDHPLLLPMYRATPQSARVGVGRRLSFEPIEPSRSPHRSEAMSTETERNERTYRPLELTLQVDPATGVARVVRGNGNAPPGAASGMDAASTASGAGAGLAPFGWARETLSPEALTLEERKKARRPAPFDAPFDSDYAKRKGYIADYLGNGISVKLPAPSAALQQAAVKLIGSNEYVLKYHNFSVVMHKERRFAMYSAANVNFGERFDMSRTSDVWREDPRIPREAQVTNFLYAANQFDRGHLTRREDLEFGATPKVALQSAADTCHWTNCCPQHERFNQNKEIWQGIERHVLEEAILQDHFKAQVITGPVFDEGDPEFKKIQYPVSYWKVVAAINSEDKLVATAYVASQAAVIDRFGIEAAPIDPFGPFKTFQVPIEEIERLTQLSFTYDAGKGTKPLRDVDPLNSRSARDALRRRRRARPFESAPVVSPSGYVELSTLDDIVV